MEDGSLLHRSLAVSVTAHVRLPHTYIKYKNPHVKELRRVLSVVCETPCSTHSQQAKLQGWKPQNLTTSSIGQLTALQSRVPHIPLLPPGFWSHEPILLWKLAAGHIAGGRKAKGISPRLSITRAHQWACLENILLKWNAFMVGESTA